VLSEGDSTVKNLTPPPAVGFINLSEGPVAAVVSYSETELLFTRIYLPTGFQPIGMINQRFGYLINNSRDAILLYDFSEQLFYTVVDLRGSDNLIQSEIAFNESWLVWIELAPQTIAEDGRREQKVLLMAKSLTEVIEAYIEAYNESFLLAASSITPLQVFKLPFSSLSLDGDNLIYRYSETVAGYQMTEARLLNLQSGSSAIIDRRSEYNFEQILHVSISRNLVAWDVQHRFMHYSEGLPDYEYAVYSIFSAMISENADVLEREVLSHFYRYYAPFVDQGRIYALLFHAPSSVYWYSDAMEVIHYLRPELRIAMVQRVTSSIVVITPGSIPSAIELVGDYEFAWSQLNEFFWRELPLSIDYRDISVGSRFLSWQSNIADMLYHFDIHYHRFVIFPCYFFEPYAVYDEFELCVVAVPGLDADYFYFSLFSERESPYILRVE
jgi:hypothetical protein